MRGLARAAAVVVAAALVAAMAARLAADGGDGESPAALPTTTTVNEGPVRPVSCSAHAPVRPYGTCALPPHQAWIAPDLGFGFFYDYECPGAAGGHPCAGEVFATRDGGGTWEIHGVVPEVTPPFDGPPVLRFATEDEGFVLVGPTLFETYDGARTWTRANVGGLISAVAVRDGFVWAVADCEAGAGCATVRRKRVGERAWEPATVDVASPGTAASTQVRMLVDTARSGLRWFQLSPPCEHFHGGPGDVTALDTRAVWMTCRGEPGGTQGRVQIWSSADAGSTWTLVGDNGVPDAQKVGDVPPQLFSAVVAPNGSLFGIAGYSTILRSTDSGARWRVVAPIDAAARSRGVQTIDWLDTNRGVAWGVCDVARTTDGGATWSVVKHVDDC